MLGLVTMAACFMGHIVRDGWPAWKTLLKGLLGTKFEWLWHLSTELARVSGAAVCGLGIAALYGLDLWAAAFTLAVLVGFFTDMDHGEGQQALGWADAGYLAVSGFTSLLPIGIAAAAHTWDLRSGAVILLGLLKPPVWFACWKLFPQRGWFLPTRVAAGLFGAVAGAALWLVK